MNDLNELRKLSISDLSAMKKHLRKDYRYWRKEADNADSEVDREACRERANEVHFFLEWVEEILNEKVYSFKIEDSFNV